MRDKILPEVPDQWSPSQKQGARLPSDTNYEDVIVPSSNYQNIALDAFEIVDDHVYDSADKVLNKQSSFYHITGSNAHVKAVTQMALAQTKKQGAQERTENDPMDHKFGRLRQHSLKDANDPPPLAMSPTTAAFVPPRDVPRPHPSPIHYLNTSSMDRADAQAGWKGPSPPHSGSPKVAYKVHESPVLPPKAFAFPTIPPKDSNTPTLPSKPTAPLPSPKTLNPGASPKKAPIPPPKIISQAPIPPAKTAHEAPFVRPKATTAPLPPARILPEAPNPPPRSVSEAPIPPPRSEPEAPSLPPKTPSSASGAPISPWRSEAPAPPRRASEPESGIPSVVSPPRVPSSQFNSRAVHPKPLKRPTGASGPVPIPPPKPLKQEPPPPPPKSGNSQFNKNVSGGMGGHNTFPQPGVRMLPVNEIAQHAAAVQQSGALTASRRYHKPS